MSQVDFIYKEINKLKNKYNRIKKNGINETNLDDSSHLKLFNDEDNNAQLNDINPISNSLQ